MAHRILIVDDDAQLREMMAELLEFEGFDADVACNGQEALDKVHENRPRVIVLDMMMPVMDGWTFRAHQRHDTRIADIPVVVLSAAPVGRLANVGAAAVLQKPFEYEWLVSAVRANC